MTRMFVDVTSRSGRCWTFHFYGDPKHIEEWRADGLEVYVVENTIPVWAVECGLTRIWCAVQDLWQMP
jgi:hypothetical protein